MKPAALLIVLLLPTATHAHKSTAKNTGQGKMEHCPSTVSSAKTTVTELPDGVAISVQGGNASEIQKRAAHLLEVSKSEVESIAHAGNGHGGGGVGHCPVVLKDTLLTVENLADGAKITVKPTKSIDVEWLKKETRSRMAEKPKPAKK